MSSNGCIFVEAGNNNRIYTYESKYVMNKRAKVILAIISSLAITGCLSYQGWIFYKNDKAKSAKISSLEAALVQKDDELKRVNDKANDLSIHLTDETKRRESVEKEKEISLNVGATLYAQNKLIREALENLANSFDDFDALILADDKRNIAIVNWFYQNAQFTVGSWQMDTAITSYDTWLAAQKRSDTTYKNIKNKAINDLKEASQAIEIINSLDLNSFNKESGSQTD